MTVRKRANNTPVTPPPTNTKTKIEDDKQKNGNATQITNKENEDDNSIQTQFPAAMTERQQNGSSYQQQKQPNGGDSGGNSNDTKSNVDNGPLLSIRLDVYHNLRSLKESLNAFSTQDFSKIPLHLWSVLKDRTKHVDKSMTGISLYAFTIMFALALITRFYAISWPHHVW